MRNVRMGRAITAVSRLWLAPILCIALARLLFDRVIVEGDSGRPTLLPGDVLLAFRFPVIRKVARGDLVVIHGQSGRYLVKRVVGLPGERVTIDGRGISIDGRLVEEPYVILTSSRYLPPGDWMLPGGNNGCYFLLGDNRGMSMDSRHFGGVERSRIRSRAAFRLWPVSRFGPL
jgi:signal peptidase I